jgi:amidase
VTKDLIDVAGHRTGAGNPAWLDEAEAATEHAPAVRRLLDAGADLVGKAITDELAFSLAGTNAHYGTPVNVHAPGRVPGGSSSGSAAAVAGGLCDVALGSDTGGSVRVPASYCGVWGLRPSTGAAPMGGVVPLAPSYDVVGVLAASGPLLAAAGGALLGTAPGARPARLVLAGDVLARADPAVAEAVGTAAERLADELGAPLTSARLSPDGDALDRWHGAFALRMLFEAWATHGQWITARRPPLGPEIAELFAFASSLPDPGDAARTAADEVVAALDTLLGDGGVLVLPSAVGPAPPVGAGLDAMRDIAARTVGLTCLAGLAGAPQLSMPLATVHGLPLGVGLLACPGGDATLLAAAAG